MDQATVAYVEALPKRASSQSAGWKATRLTPCPLLLRCPSCVQYKPVIDFYVLETNDRSKRDILGSKRSCRCSACHRSDYTKLDPRKKLYYAARQRATLKGHEFTIRLDDIMIPECCPVFGFKLEATIGQGRLPLSMLERSPSLDRIDNSKGYVPGNVCVISLRANNVKKDATLNELRALVRYVEEFGPSEDAKPEPLTTATNQPEVWS
jgi:hypothetical protein